MYPPNAEIPIADMAIKIKKIFVFEIFIIICKNVPNIKTYIRFLRVCELFVFKLIFLNLKCIENVIKLQCISLFAP